MDVEIKRYGCINKISPVIYTACNNLFQMLIYVCVFIYLLLGLCVYLFSSLSFRLLLVLPDIMC